MRSDESAGLEFTLVSTLLRSGTLDFDGFLMLMGNKNRETDIEIHYKDTFRAFSKDDDGANLILLSKLTIYPFLICTGCIPAEELKFVMNHLPGKVNFQNQLICSVVVLGCTARN